jgi:hydroxymethylpyrimidine/phosphomethylpyrimidine kinase
VIILKHCLTIAGSDSCGGAGIQADLKTFSALETYGMSVITAITAQNTQGVFATQNIDPEIVSKQIEVLFDDIKIDAIKIGMVSTIDIIKAISKSLGKFPLPKLVVDPVMISKCGFDLLRKESKDALVKELFPIAYIITPNLLEAEDILGYEIKNVEDMKKAARDLHRLGPENVLVKGGHLEGDAIDVLYDGENYHIFEEKRIDCIHTHGTGCTLSSAIAAHLAKGFHLVDAVKHSKDYISTAIAHGISIGKGVGPTNHFYNLYNKKGE